MITLLLPSLLAVAAASSSGRIQRRLRPDLAVPILAVMAALSALATVGALLLLAIGATGRWWSVVGLAGWCTALPGSEHVSPGLGAFAAAVLAVISVRLVLRVRRTRVASDLLAGPEREVLDAHMAIAFAVPGRPGRVVVTRGLLDRLAPDERDVVWEHESAHLEQRHGLYIRVAEISASVPLLLPLAAQVRYAAERAADEAAAEAVGSRRTVARAVARAALLTAGAWLPATALTVGGSDVDARIGALLGDSPRSGPLATVRLALISGVLAITLAASTVQIHHLVEFAGHICRVG